MAAMLPAFLTGLPLKAVHVGRRVGRRSCPMRARAGHAWSEAQKVDDLGRREEEEEFVKGERPCESLIKGERQDRCSDQRRHSHLNSLHFDT